MQTEIPGPLQTDSSSLEPLTESKTKVKLASDDPAFVEVCRLLRAGRPEFMEKAADWLTEKSASIQHPGYSLLHFAVCYGSLEDVKFLLDAGAEVDQPARQKSTALMLGTALRRLDVVKQLLGKGADPTGTFNSEGFAAFHLACHTDDVEFLQQWLALFSDEDRANILSCKDGHGQGPIQSALQRELPEMARQLIDLGADPNQADSYDNLPLSMALFSQNMQLVNYLVDRGADIHKVGARGETPLTVAKRIYSDVFSRSLEKRWNKANPGAAAAAKSAQTEELAAAPADA